MALLPGGGGKGGIYLYEGVATVLAPEESERLLEEAFEGCVDIPVDLTRAHLERFGVLHHGHWRRALFCTVIGEPYTLGDGQEAVRVWTEPIAREWLGWDTATAREFDQAFDQEARSAGFPEMVRKRVGGAINFLLALNAGYLDIQNKQPTKRPKNPAKIRKLERRGILTRPYTRVDLGGRAKSERKAQHSTPSNEKGTLTTAHLVRGHWHGYWVKDPGDRPVLDTKQTQHGERHLVLKWLFPYRKGPEDAPLKQPKYKSGRAP